MKIGEYLTEGKAGDPEYEYNVLYKKLMDEFKQFQFDLRTDRTRFKKANDKWSFVDKLKIAYEKLGEVDI